MQFLVVFGLSALACFSGTVSLADNNMQFLVVFGLSAIACFSGTVSSAANNVDPTALPEGFIMATATSSYQIEGAWNLSGKGLSIWDTFTHEHPDRITDGSNGDIACDSYNLYKTDVQMVYKTGFNAYRFSISWPRVLPNGTTDNVNAEGVQFYHNLIDELLAYNITPVVTMYHWDLPQALQDFDGWINSTIADYFEAYADFLFSEYGSKVKYWVTINEPSSILYGYGGPLIAPGIGQVGVTDYITNHNLLRAHARAYRLYDRKYRATQNGLLGVAYQIHVQRAYNDPSDVYDLEAVNRAWAWDLGMFADPIYAPEGNYPSIVREHVDRNSYAEGRNESRLPHFTVEELAEIRGSFDYIGVNHYNTSYVTDVVNGSSPSMPRDSEITTVEQIVEVDGIRVILNHIKDKYGNIPVLITESGIDSTLGLNDTDRVSFFDGILTNMLAAINEDGCNVFGYTVWSLMDNYEWYHGYGPKYGIWNVDFDDSNRTRTKKLSANYFQELLSEGRLPNITNYGL